MSKTTSLLIAALTSLAAAALAGCSPENVPHAPTFEADIKPIMLSRCVRCHGAGGHLNGDPSSTALNFKAPPYDGFFDRMADNCPDGEPTGCHGLGHYTTADQSPRLVSFIHGTNVSGPMPPLPAPRLTTRQLDTIDLWLANGAPEN